MVKKTYNDIIRYLNLFAEVHMDIFRFESDDLDQMSEITSKEEKFPMVYLVPINNSYDYEVDTYTLRVYCYDRLMKDRSNEINCKSKTNQILNDMNIWLRKESSLPFEISDVSYVYPFDSALMTDVSGWYMEVTIEVPSYSECDIPFLNKPILPIGVCK